MRGLPARANVAVGVAGVSLILLLAGCTPGANIEDTSEQPSTSATPSSGDGTDERVFRGTRHEYAEAVAECLQRGGWDAEVSPVEEDGGRSLIIDTPPEQEAEFDAALQSCHDSLGRLESGLGEPGALRQWYDYQVERASCLVTQGWAVDPVPSFETVSDEYATEGIISWNAEAGIPDTELSEARQACPDTDEF